MDGQFLARAICKIANVSKKFFWKVSHLNPVPLLDYTD